MIRKMIKILICYVVMSPWQRPTDIGSLCQYYLLIVKGIHFYIASVAFYFFNKDISNCQACVLVQVHLKKSVTKSQIRRSASSYSFDDFVLVGVAGRVV